MKSTKDFIIQKDLTGLSEVIVNIENILTGNKTTQRKRVMATLLTEECVVKLAAAAKEGSEIKVRITHFLRKTYINIVSKGSAINLSDVLSADGSSELPEEYGAETAEAIRNIVLRSNAKDITYKHFSGFNVVSILVARNDNTGLMDVAMAIALAVVTGVTLRLCLPTGVVVKLSDTLFAPLYTIFLNAIKMIMAPLVFFSIANSLGDFSNLKNLGRSGIKVFSYYTITTIFAMLIAWGASHLFHSDVTLEDLNIIVTEDLSTAQKLDISLVDTLVNMVPSNIIGAFGTSDMMQIIVLAIIIGIAMGKIGEYSQKMHELVGMFDALFGSITALIIKFLPVAVYGSFTTLILTMNLDTMEAVSSWVGVTLLCIGAMFCVYMLMLAFVGHLNPMQFIRKYNPVAVTALSTSSSSATLPAAINCCQKMGVSPGIYKLSIPLGSTINMDGTTIYLVVSTMFLSLISGVEIPLEAYMSLGVTILLLSMAAPAVPGAAIACLSTLLAIVGIPNESMAVLIGILPLLDPIFTASNVIGDGVVTTLVAKSENALDMEKFNSIS